MPYIAKDQRPAEGDKWPEYTDPGGLNYRLTMLVSQAHDAYIKPARIVAWVLMEVNEYLDRITVRDGKLGYAQYNEVLGVLDAARREHIAREWWRGTEAEGSPSIFTRAGDLLYAARVRPYEERKIAENGDL